MIAVMSQVSDENSQLYGLSYMFEVKTFLLVFFITLLLAKFIQSVKNWKKTPPGPWGFPIIGHLPLLGKHPHKTLNDFGKQYGDIFSIRMGSWPTVILNSRDAIYEAFVKKSEHFADRPGFFSAKMLNNQRSLAFGKYDARWKMHRKIGNNVLRMFASVKNNPVEESIQKEAIDLTRELIHNTNSQNLDPREFIFLAVGSVLYQICYGKDEQCKERDDFRFQVLQTKAFIEFTGAGNPVDVMPWLRFFMPWKVNGFKNLIKTSQNFRGKKIEEHLQTFDENNLRDAADGFILAGKEVGDLDKSSSGITKEDIHSSLSDITGAGFETVATTLEWCLLYASVFPEVQQKVQMEIDNVIGQRCPGIKDRGKMPYTEATILEVLRMCTIAPLGIPHATTNDVMLRDFFIPKGTVVFANLYSVSFDKTFWTDPEKFQPERFLTNNNEIDQEKAEYVLSFGAGRRRCLGEFLAKMELFIFFTTLLQQCNFEMLEGTNYTLEGITGLTNKNVPFKIKVSSR